MNWRNANTHWPNANARQRATGSSFLFRPYVSSIETVSLILRVYRVAYKHERWNFLIIAFLICNVVQKRGPIDRPTLTSLRIFKPVDDREVDRRPLSFCLPVALEGDSMAVAGPDICRICWRRLRTISGKSREGEATRDMVAYRTRVVDGLRVFRFLGVVP